MPLLHPEQIVTALFTALKHNPEGCTINVSTLANSPIGVYAIGGFVQEIDGFNALAYRMTEDLKRLLDEEEFYGDIVNRVTRHIDAIREHGYLGGWYEHGELFIDVVECWTCEHGDADAEYRGLTAGRARQAIRQAHTNKQDAIGHVCDSVPLGYETIYVNGGNN